MNRLLKTLMAGGAPAFLAAGVLAAENGTPATAPATQAATQPVPQLASSANSRAPLVIPDGTSLENPGPYTPNQNFRVQAVAGLRR